MINNLTYIINNTLLFSPEDCTLSQQSDQNKIELLSKPAARLFNELITLYQNGHLATRDELLTNVWENHGLVGSNNNLNTYISEIRKKIEKLGENPKLIVTIPKKGFRLDGEIKQYFSTEHNNQESVNTDSIDHHDEISFQQNIKTKDNNEVPVSSKQEIAASKDQDLNNEKTDNCVKTYQPIIDNNDEKSITIVPEIKKTPFYPHKIRVFKDSRKTKTGAVIIIIVFFLYCLFLFISKNSFSFSQIAKYNEITKIDHCSLQISSQRHRNLNDYDITMIKKIFNDNNISCTQGDKFIFLSHNNTSIDINGDYFIGVCDEINNKKMNCISINQQRL
ncbi:winged helix-turn-helix domain-containing protein [Moellerella wisconsensis]|uniref:Winged helix-turn-helix domain-containing protein n=1 Tax=Moellerella wisconsensis TaxID=158849 RepID=A0A9Q8Q032_9GAMM|nr:winged helix-turn-helix domain-containing protein [Moellerella wisconsensis]UNH30459.1 winged helix-turn-helix domain-containing protein [Moellerella wisconsensis]